MLELFDLSYFGVDAGKEVVFEFIKLGLVRL
jgi:hypothetical protein